jgi:hypothetical protein
MIIQNSAAFVKTFPENDRPIRPFRRSFPPVKGECGKPHFYAVF